MSALSTFTRLAGQLMLGERGELGQVTESHEFQLDHELTRAFASYTVQYLKEYAANPDDHLFRVALIYHSTQSHPWGSETLRLTDNVVRMIYPVSNIGSRELTSFQKKKRENSVHYGTELLLTYALKDTPDVPIFLPVLFDRGTTLVQYENLTSTTVMLSEPPDTPVIEVLNLVGPAMTARKNMDAFMELKQRLERRLIDHDARRPMEMKIVENEPASPKDRPMPAPAAAPAAAPATPSGAHKTAVSAPRVPALDTAGSKHWYHPALHDATCEALARFLTQPRKHPDIDQVRRFARFRDLTLSQQKDLAHSCPLYKAPAHAPLLERGSNDQWNLYLLQGQIELTAADGEKKILVGESENARNAIAALKPRKFSVMALTPVVFLWIHEDIVAEIQSRRPAPKF